MLKSPKMKTAGNVHDKRKQNPENYYPPEEQFADPEVRDSCFGNRCSR
jgi:hypothetical protein